MRGIVVMVNILFLLLCLTVVFLENTKTNTKLIETAIQKFSNNNNNITSNTTTASNSSSSSPSNYSNDWQYRTPLPGFPGYDSEAPIVVVQLGGEMANNLGYIAHGLAHVWRLERDHGINATLVLRHQDRPKWKRGEADLKTCFPFSANFSFTDGNDPEVTAEANTHSFSNLSQFVDTYLMEHSSTNPKLLGYITTPVFTERTMIDSPSAMDPYYDELRQVFHFDESCCAQVPDPDESVFHFRNFRQEMPRVYKRLGFWEMGPNRTADDLFGHLKAGDKVAITSRFEAGIQPYVEALQRRGIQARAVTGQTGVQDFCFLLNAKKELVGTRISTFFLYAAVLGNATLIRNYKVNLQDMPRMHEVLNSTQGRWTRTEMIERYREELYENVTEER